MRAVWARVWPSRSLPICGAASSRWARQDIASERAAAALDALRLAARTFPRPLGRAAACRGDHLFDLDGGRPLAPHRLRRAARGQAAGAKCGGSVRSWFRR